MKNILLIMSGLLVTSMASCLATDLGAAYAGGAEGEMPAYLRLAPEYKREALMSLHSEFMKARGEDSPYLAVDESKRIGKFIFELLSGTKDACLQYVLFLVTECVREGDNTLWKSTIDLCVRGAALRSESVAQWFLERRLSPPIPNCNFIFILGKRWPSCAPLCIAVLEKELTWWNAEKKWRVILDRREVERIDSLNEQIATLKGEGTCDPGVDHSARLV